MHGILYNYCGFFGTAAALYVEIETIIRRVGVYPPPPV